MRLWNLAALLCFAMALTACGSSGTTTVIKEAPAETVEAAPAPTAEHASATPKAEPPNVLGLPLPAAKQMLQQAGYKTLAKNTDTTFGIIVPSNYTICNQGKPRGNIVVVLAQKYGC
jgi:hypothetical protein